MADEVTLESIRQALDKILPDDSRSKPFFPAIDFNDDDEDGAAENNIKNVFSKVQGDIEAIKTKVLNCLSSGQPIDHEEIKVLFENTEKNLENQRVEARFQELMSRPAVIPYEKVFRDDEHIEMLPGLNDENFLPPIDISMVKELGKSISTPGDRVLALQELKSIIDPLRKDNREVLNKHYGVPAPPDHLKIEKPVHTRSLAVKKSMKPFQQDMDEKKAAAGSNLVSKGGMKLQNMKKDIKPISPLKASLSQLPIKPQSVVLHKHADRKNVNRLDQKNFHNLALVKFDDKPNVSSSPSVFNWKNQNSLAGSEKSDSSLVFKKSIESHIPTANDLESALELLPTEQQGLLTITEKGNDMLVPVPSPLADVHGTHKFAIENGKTRDNTVEFLSYKQHYIHIYQAIATLLHKMESLMKDYSVPIAFIDGDRLVDVALFFEIGPLKPTIKDLLVSVINSEDVERIIKIPGRRYMAADGKNQAAMKLQATWRRYKKRYAYLEYRRKKWAAGLIALTWIMKCKITLIRKVMKNNQATFLEKFRDRAKKFSDSWSKLKSSKRLLIHIPSLGYPLNIRHGVDNIAVIENQQIARIFDVMNPDVEVIYISPVDMNEQLKQYYSRLIEIMCQTTNQNYETVKERLKIITPDSVGKFPEQNLCTSTMIKYSTRTLSRLKELVKGKQAYIVPSVAHIDDLYVAEKLNVPILGSEPDLASLYSLKSGIRRIFNAASVKCPPGEYDIYSMHQLHESLARLVTENLHIKRWLFKIDNDFNGRGTAYCDVTPHLRCYQHAIHEQEKYGERWSQKWANENVFNEILKEIPSIIEQYSQTVDDKAYDNWQEFIDAFLRQGGVVEASPPTASVTGLTSHVFIEPDGNVSVTAVTDQVHSTSPYKCFGYTLPQSSIGSAVINSCTLAIAEACRQRGIVGYMSIDFVTFICPKTEEQELWAVGLFIGYSSSFAMFRFINALTNGSLDIEENSYHVTIENNISNNIFYRSRRRKTEPSHDLIVEKKQRFCVYSSHLLHSNMNNVQYNVFFQLCKARGIGYDEKMKLGTSFAIFDHTRRNSMGMITIGESLHEAVTLFALNLQLIHADISSLRMQGFHNFTGAVDDLKLILRCLEENKQIDQDHYPTASPTFKKYHDSSHDVIRDVITPTRTHSSYSGNRSRDLVATPIRSLTNNESEIFDHRLPSSPVSDVSLFPNKY